MSSEHTPSAELEALALDVGFRVHVASSAHDAKVMRDLARPAITLTGLDLSAASQLETLATLHAAAPGSPLVVVSEQTDAESIQVAMSHGAGNVIASPLHEAEARFVMDRIYKVYRAEAVQTIGRDVSESRATELSFRARPGLLSNVIAFLAQELQEQFTEIDAAIAEVKLALHEAFANAMEHGNLGISFEEKTQAMGAEGSIHALVERRLNDPRLSARRVFVRAEYSRDGVMYVVRDEGSGFDFRARINKPMAEATALHGRGLKMIEFYMDRVEWNDLGNELRMHKRVRIAADETQAIPRPNKTS